MHFVDCDMHVMHMIKTPLMDVCANHCAQHDMQFALAMLCHCVQ